MCRRVNVYTRAHHTEVDVTCTQQDASAYVYGCNRLPLPSSDLSFEACKLLTNIRFQTQKVGFRFGLSGTEATVCADISGSLSKFSFHMNNY